MRLTTTATSKGQLTIPKTIREKLGLRKGTKVDIHLTEDGFIGQIQRKSNILSYAGDLKAKDKGEPLNEIRLEAQRKAAASIVKKLR